MVAVWLQKVVCSLSTTVMMETFTVNAADVQPCQKPISYKNIFVP
jgi:hypothetical protein